MHRNILTIGIPDSLLNALESTVQKDKVKIISSPNIKIAKWLLEHRKFAVIILDLEHFLQLTPDFLNEIRQQSPYVIVLGNAGTKYNWRVEDSANLFLSYQISLSKLWALIMDALSLRTGN
ncbi:hypothetical protein AALB19_11440 [Oscillospiraceae bacterium 50-58]